MTTLKSTRVMFTAKGQTGLDQADLPSPGPGQVALKALSTVISPGTELAYLHQMENAQWPLPGLNNGYCFCGTVVALGTGVTDLKVGQRVVAGVRHVSHAVTEAAACFPVPDALAPDHAATFMLAAISLQAVRKGRIRLGQSVAVVGLGVIGNYAGQLARAAGATLVVGIDQVAWRRDIALKSGFDAVSDSAAGFPFDQYPQLKKSQGFDVVIEATGAPSPIIDAFRLARRLGTVALLGSTRGLTQSVDFYNDVHRKGITIVGAHNNARPVSDDIDVLFTLASDIRTCLDLLAGKRITAATLISDTVTPADAPQAYHRLFDRANPLMTVAINWA
jgi:threonine dehydrogenase-like Zn-dependent dehydrogenase